MNEFPGELQKTTIQITMSSKFALMKIKGELVKKDGIDRTFDDVIQELVYYWIRGVRRKGYRD